MICNKPTCGGCYEIEPGVHVHPPVSTSEWPDRWTRYWRECREVRERLHPKRGKKIVARNEEAAFDWR